MPKYSPDIAGIMSCICDALVDRRRGVKGCVLESSDNDNRDGEIYIDVTDSHGQMEQYLIKVVPGRLANW